MIDWVLGFWANKWIAFGIYWVPLALCGVGYLIKSAKEIQEDRACRDKTNYRPTITIGHLIGRAVLSITPLANFCAALFDIAPDLCGGFFKWMGRVFNQPLVPPKRPVGT